MSSVEERVLILFQNSIFLQGVKGLKIFAQRVQSEFGVEIPEELLKTSSTIQDYLDYISAQLKPKNYNPASKIDLSGLSD